MSRPVALAFALAPSFGTRGLVVATLICVWAVRLGSFLFIRVKKAGQDRRFTQIKTKFFRFLLTWTLGGTWVFITMAAGLAAMTSQSQSPVDAFLVVGATLWVIGFGIEVVADQQKTAFRKDPANAEKFISSGLWSISRHPNYFGEIILWIGIAVIALPVLEGWQWVTLVSPVFVSFLLLKVSGVPMLENNAESRWGNDPEFRQYKAKTPTLIPLFWQSRFRVNFRPVKLMRSMRIETMLHRISNAFVAATLVLASFVLNAQSIDLGRGELPVTVPAGYSSENPTPLIVLLHGYTSSGAMQDNYMGFSKLG
jgi:steroid 5-alpha reductase family enzyme